MARRSPLFVAREREAARLRKAASAAHLAKVQKAYAAYKERQRWRTERALLLSQRRTRSQSLTPLPPRGPVPLVEPNQRQLCYTLGGQLICYRASPKSRAKYKDSE